MKYIVVQGPDGEAPVLFPRAFMHKWVAEQLKPLDAVAAGFVRSANGPRSSTGFRLWLLRLATIVPSEIPRAPT